MYCTPTLWNYKKVKKGIDNQKGSCYNSQVLAAVLEQADRHVWGACVIDVWVQVPSAAPEIRLTDQMVNLVCRTFYFVLFCLLLSIFYNYHLIIVKLLRILKIWGKFPNTANWGIFWHNFSKNGVVNGVVKFSWTPASSKPFHPFQLFLSKTLVGVSIQIKGHIDAGMPHQILQRFGIHPSLHFLSAKSMP